jgi:hypothetical protein
MRTAVFVVVLGCGTLFTNCGGNGGSPSSGSPPPAQNPTPTIAAISPNSNDRGGPDISLNVVGSNFIDASTVEWNGSQLSTIFVNSTLLTAVIPASSFAAAGSNAVKVFNPAPGGGSSGPLTFTVPCPVPAPAAASAQTKARLGAYYFDGWSGPLTNFHFQGLPFGPYQDRQPLSGWQDNTACAIEQQLAAAHNYGVDFFVFDWYFNVQVTDPGENLNSGLQITHTLANRHGMQYAILYVDSPPFDVGPSDWNSAVNEWVGYMADPDYLRINGVPALFIINVGEMRQIFGTAVAVSSALAQLRTAAQGQGLPGVYVVGGFGVPSNGMGQPSLTTGFDIAQSDGYDAVAFYGYPFAPTPAPGPLAFTTLSGAGQWTWDQAAQYSVLPFIPTAMSGWDPRPWNEIEPTTGDLMWYTRTPQDLSAFISSAIAWTTTNPQHRPEPSPAPPLVLIEAWNEFGEGSYFLPTVADGTTYGDAIAAMLQVP